MKVRVISIVLVIAMLLGAVACTAGTTATPAESKTITFGILAPLTGTNAEYGKGF